jgi:hypothetical protein
MSVKQAILTIGFDKNNEAEFGACAAVMDLTFAEMKEIRAMIPVAIGVMEEMWRDAQMRKPENRAVQAIPSDTTSGTQK